MKKKQKKTAQNYSVQDLLHFKLVNDLRVSPDGKEIVYEVQSIDSENDSSTSQLWMGFADGAAARPFSGSQSSDSDPRWSPDGKKIAFISDRLNDTFQIFTINRGGGEAVCLTKFDFGVSSFSWFKAGDKILASATLEQEKKPEEMDDDQWEKRPKVIQQLHYKSDGNGFSLRKRSHLFIIDYETHETKQLTRGEYDVFCAAPSPDGKWIAFGRTREDPLEAHQVDLWLMHADGTHKKQLTCSVASVADPSWSPNGRYIAFNGTDESGNSVSWPSLYDLNTGELTTFKEYEIETGQAIWSNDSQSIIFVTGKNGINELVQMNIHTQKKEVLVSRDHQIKKYDGAAGTIAYYSISLTSHGDIFCYDLNRKNETRITALNDEWVKSRKHPVVQKRIFKTDQHHEVEGWLLTPANKKAPYPLLVDVHGGPHSYVEFSYTFHVYWYVLLSRGWAILALNATGSTSYSDKFKEELRGAWGEKDLYQHLSAVKTLQREGLVTDQVAIAGKSYGGYMAAWAVGHTDKFKAAVVSAPVANLESHFGTSDSGYYVGPYDMDAELLKKRDLYRRLSPVTYAHKVRTPTLVLQGEDDQRCPIGQAEEFFTAIMKNGKTQAEMVLYPEGHHNLAEEGKPSHRVDYHQRIVDWLERWCH